MGRDVANFTNEEWFKILPTVAMEVAWQKYTKVAKFNCYLKGLASYAHILEYTKNDGLWGTGLDMPIGELISTTPSEWRDAHGNQACNILGWSLTLVSHELVARDATDGHK